MDTDANKMFCKSVCNYFIEFYRREYTKLGLNKSFESLYVLILVQAKSQILNCIVFFVREHLWEKKNLFSNTVKLNA